MSAAEERLANDPTSELWGEHRSRYRFAAQFIRPGESVLDVACGTGFGLSILAEMGVWPIGVDYDGRTLANVHRKCGLVQADAMRLPLGTDSVDEVVSFETIEHVLDAQALIAEIRRVLKPGGQLILSTPNRSFGPLERHTANRFHVREFTADELYQTLADHFARVRLFGQRPSASYRYVPFLMYQPTRGPDALAWKAMLRLPYSIRNCIAQALGGRPFYPGETDYCFDVEATENAHALLAVAQ